METGLLVGRVVLKKSAFEYLIIPKRDDLDACVTTPPPQLLTSMLTVSTTKIMRTPFIVDYQWKLFPTMAGMPICRGYISQYKELRINPDNPLESVKEIDQTAEYHPYDVPPEINQEFLISLSRSSGASITTMSRRFYSLGVLAKYNDGTENSQTVFLTLAETFLWLQENLSKIKGLLLLPEFKYAIIVADEITRDELTESIISRLNTSLSNFKLLIEEAAEATGETIE